MKNIGKKLLKFIKDFDRAQNTLINKYAGDVLLFDSIFESGNLLQAERVCRTDYRLYMQVDTNTRGH
jgi:hypothetical protein